MVRIIVLVVVLAVVAYAAALYFGWGKSTVEPQHSAVKLPPSTSTITAGGRERMPQVAALGRLEPAGGLIDVGAMTGDRVARLLISDGDEVKSGQQLAILESFTLRETELAAAKATLNDAQRREPVEKVYGEALVQSAKAGVAQADLMTKDRELIESKAALAKASLAVAKADLERLTAVDGKIVSRQDREHQQLRVQQAEAEWAASQAELKKFEASLSVAKALADAKLAEASAGTKRLEASLQLDLLAQNVRLSEERLKMSTVVAPRVGKILKILTRPGETIAQRPVLRMGDTSQMVAVCEVYETQVWCVAVGQEVTLASRALGRPLHGRVSFVGQMVAKNEVLSLDPSKAADNRVVEVRVDIDEDADAAKFVNLQVDVVIDTGPRNGRME